MATDAPDDGILVNQVLSTSVGASCTGPAPNCTTVTTIAARTITLTDVTSAFTLTGLPDTTVSSDGTVTMTVTTNSTGGYLVTVQATAASLIGSAGNTETIPIELLGVRETGTIPFLPLSANTPIVVHQQDTATAPGGDAVSNDYQIQIPYVPSDNYATTLEYIVSAQ